MARTHIPFLCCCTILLAACGGAGGADTLGTGPGTSNNPPVTPTGPLGTNSVTIADNAFNPAAVSISPGTAVIWKWAACTPDTGSYGGYSSTCPTHNVTFDDGSNIASQTQDSGDFTRTFATAGTYKYHCTIHGAAMSGQIVVK